jgi:hypothetical protein
MLDVLGFPSGAHQERNHGQRHMPTSTTAAGSTSTGPTGG